MTAAAEPRLRLNARALAFAALLPLGLALLVAGAVDAARVTGLDLAGSGVTAVAAIGWLYSRA